MSAFSDVLQQNYAAVKVRFTWLGMKKAIDGENLESMAERVDASSNAISATKKLLNTKHPALRKLSSVKLKIVNLWKQNSIPFTEDGVRLMPRHVLSDFNDLIQGLSQELTEAARELQDAYPAMKQEQSEILGALFDERDYLDRVDDKFSCAVEFVSVEPPDFLKETHQAVYEQERVRIAAQLEQSVKLAEQAFANEFAELVSHCAEQLGEDENGKQKRFRAENIENLQTFFNRFKLLNVGSNPTLDTLVGEVENLVTGVDVEKLRKQTNLRETIKSSLGKVAEQLDGMIVEKPSRRIVLD